MKPQTPLILLAVGLSGLVFSGCAPGPKSTQGFVFPEGDIARGKATFVELNCYECHRVDGVVDLPPPEIPDGKVIMLGGEVPTTKTYGDLITAIIHPAEDITARAADRTRSDEIMPTVNDIMTVQEMLDLVTFLSPRYQKLRPIYHDPLLP